jgi:hypothetical protein
MTEDDPPKKEVPKKGKKIVKKSKVSESQKMLS